MRSGLYNYLESPELSASANRDPTRIWKPEELLAIAFAHPPNFPPGTAFEYNNTNYALLGLIAEPSGWQAAGPGDAGPVVRTAGPEANVASRQHRGTRSPNRIRTAICTGAPRSP